MLPSGDSFTFVLNYIPGAQPGVEECAEISVESWALLASTPSQKPSQASFGRSSARAVNTTRW